MAGCQNDKILKTGHDTALALGHGNTLTFAGVNQPHVTKPDFEMFKAVNDVHCLAASGAIIGIVDVAATVRASSMQTASSPQMGIGSDVGVARLSNMALHIVRRVTKPPGEHYPWR